MASSTSTSRTHPPRCPQFTPIPEQSEKEEKETAKQNNNSQLSVYLTKCRPSPRDVFPLDQNYESTPLSRTILHSLFRKTPKRTPTSSTSAPESNDWKLIAHDLSLKLLHVSRRRDEAILEASRLKHLLSDLQLKLKQSQAQSICNGNSDRTDLFVMAVKDARKAVRVLTRAISGRIRPGRIATMMKLPILNTGDLLVYTESLLNRIFYNGFSVDGFAEDSGILDPVCRAELNRKRYEVVRDLTWEQVLVTGTKHYSKELSKFCDEKMSEIVTQFGGIKEWPELLLAAFFAAAKGVWVVKLLAGCAYPPVVTEMRVERGVAYDSKYMEDVTGGSHGVKVTPVSVKVVVAPGFYLWRGGCGVVKCKVECEYSESENCSKVKK